MLYLVSTNTLFSKDKHSIQSEQIQYPVTTNTISSYDKCLINLSQIHHPVKTNIISSKDNYNIQLRRKKIWVREIENIFVWRKNTADFEIMGNFEIIGDLKTLGEFEIIIIFIFL